MFWSATALYAAVGLYLAFDAQFFLGDSLSRVAAARTVFFSNDPHLAAIGFIFTPLTALAQLPTILLSHWWTEVSAYAVTALAVSAPFMAGAVVQIYKIGRDRGVPTWLLWLVTAVFALNPLVLFYGANGMSEAPFVFLLCWSARRLIRWTATDDVHDLVLAGIALAIGYLARYDALAAAGSVTVLVFAVTFLRSRQPTRVSRLRQAFIDAVLVALPVFVAFFVWSFTSWLITGEALQQVSSSYGNSAILEQSGGGAANVLGALAFSLAETAVTGPALPVLIPLVAALAWRRRDPEPLVALVAFGSVLAFATLTYALGSTFPFLRFYIAALPLMLVLTYQLVPARGVLTARREGPNSTPRHTDGGDRRPLSALAAVLVVATPVVTAAFMTSATLAPQEYALEALVRPGADPGSAKRADQDAILQSFRTERELARYLDSLGLPDGSVVMDTVYGFAVYTATERPETFVVPSDFDFTEILNDPAGHGVRYILSVPDVGRGTSDATNRRYPTLYDTGADIATLELEIPNTGADQPVWRLYRVLG
ncbi:ABC transporter [Rhodococcus sp. HNM0569]|nr:glycosyltransferase family 39 protein [Rhodococcus sp. HNM0569]NLU83335.1 ABC transporter [Rhodococcus sp. HNM0569]